MEPVSDIGVYGDHSMGSISDLVDIVYTVLGIIRNACREPCARRICDELEDTLMILLDEAGDTEHVSPIAIYAVERAASSLQEAVEKAKRNNCNRAAVLFQQASELLEEIIDGG